MVRGAGSRRNCRPIRLGAVGAAALVGTWQLDGVRARRALGWSPSRADPLDAGLYVRRLGTSGPVLLLLHGLTASGRFWGGSFDPLAARAQLVVPDLLGFGSSPRPETGFGADDHVDAIVECLERLGLGNAPLVIGAHSLGTLIAVRLAVRYASRVRSVVAFSPPWYADRSSALDAMRGLGPMARLSAVHEGAAHAVCNWVCAHRRAAAALATFVAPELPRAIAVDSVQHTWPSFSESLEVILAAPTSTWLDETDAPMHLVAGGRDPVVDRGYLSRVTARHAHVTLEVWPDARHLVPLGHAAMARSILDDVLREVGASG